MCSCNKQGRWILGGLEEAIPDMNDDGFVKKYKDDY